MAMEGQHRLASGKGQHVDRGRQRQHGQSAPAEFSAVHHIENPRADPERAQRANGANGAHNDDQEPQAGTKCSELAPCGQPRQTWEKRRLDRLEHEQWDTGQEHAIAEPSDHSLVTVG